MREATRLADQLRRSLVGPSWSGPSVYELLEGLAPEQAAARPIPEMHSIWAMLRHMQVWQDIVRERLAGGPGEILVGGPRDWAEPEKTSESAWWEMRHELSASMEALCAAVAEHTARELDEPLRDGDVTRYAALHGVAQHNYYHAGQIAVLKRVQGLPAVLKPDP